MALKLVKPSPVQVEVTTSENSWVSFEGVTLPAGWRGTSSKLEPLTPTLCLLIVELPGFRPGEFKAGDISPKVTGEITFTLATLTPTAGFGVWRNGDNLKTKVTIIPL